MHACIVKYTFTSVDDGVNESRITFTRIIESNNVSVEKVVSIL